MTEAEMEAKAAVVRQRLLEIWQGNTAAGDAWTCFMMKYCNDAWDREPPEARNPDLEAKILQMLAMLIHR